MKEFHLPPNDPRIQNMTLEQRNFVISSMNEDANEQQGHKTKTQTDTSKDDFLTEPEDEFSPLPKKFDQNKFKRTIGDMLGVSNVQEEQALLKSAKAKQKHRIAKGEHDENTAYVQLRHKAQVYKKKGINKGNMLGNSQNKKAHGFKV